MKLIGSILLVMLFANCYSQNLDSSSVKKKIPWFVQRFRLKLGSFVPISNTEIGVAVVGTYKGKNYDFESDLGLERSQLTFLTNFQWRASRRSRFALNYYNIPRSATHVLDKEIIFEDQTYPVNATVNSYFNTVIYHLSYGYVILSKPTYELGVLAGGHLAGGETGMSLVNSNGTASASTDFGFIAPLPDIGIWGVFAFSDRIAVNADFSYLSMAVDNYSGSILAYNLLFFYQLIDHLDLTLGFSGLNAAVGVYKKKYEGHLEWSYNGVSLGVTYSFGKKSWKRW